jgi:hypothetical protein
MQQQNHHHRILAVVPPCRQQQKQYTPHQNQRNRIIRFMTHGR